MRVTPVHPVLKQELIKRMCRECIPDTIEARRQVKRTNGTGDVEYGPGQDKERYDGHRDDRDSGVDEKEMDMHGQPDCHPG
jgi:hypothetical protein